MKTKQQGKLKSKIMILAILFIVFVLMLKISMTLASNNPFAITNVEVLGHSDTVYINDVKVEKNKLKSNITFHNVGESVSYKIKVKNNDKENYKIKSIRDDNENNYISYTYDNYEGTAFNTQEEVTLEIIQKYIKECDINSRDQKFQANIIITLEDENGDIIEKTIPINSNPVTGDNIGIYIISLLVSITLLIIALRKNTIQKSGKHTYKKIKLFSLFVIGVFVLPSISKATGDINFTLIFENSIYLRDKLRVSYIINDIENERIVNYNEKLEEFIAPKIEGYEFDGWKKEDGSDFDLDENITEDIILKAKYRPIDYTVTYNGLTEEEKQTLNNPTTYNVEIEKITLHNPSNRKDSDGEEIERFVGWRDDVTVSMNITLPPEKLENKVYEAVWVTVDPNIYTITYDLDNGTVETENRTSFTKFDTFTLNNPTKRGYTFKGWTGSNGTIPQETVTIPVGTRENLNYVANWIPTEYTITYNLNGGTVEGNPNTYTIESDDININRPAKKGYEFNGWTGTDVDTLKLDITIQKGSIGNREYIANWMPINYTIDYEGLTEEEENALNNPTTYNIETERITLNNPANRTDIDGDEVERFEGWRDGSTILKDITLPPEKLENKVYEAVWGTVDPNIYKVTYDLDNGTVETENRTSFTKFDTFTLNNPTKRGYTFKGWTGSNGTIPQETVTIPEGIRENLNYVANWIPIEYTIIYNLNGGTVEGNPNTYTIESDDININRPTKKGYAFDGWTGTDVDGLNLDITIPKGSIGNREYTANYSEKAYEIVFDNNSGSGYMENQKMLYDIEANLKENTFSKSGYEFIGWNTKPDGKGISYSDKQSVIDIGDITLYAQWMIEGAVAEVNGVYYLSLKTAVESVPSDNTETRVRLLKDVSENLIIKENQNIIFDLQNYSIKDNINDAVITNNGTVKIINGKISTNSTNAGAINNNPTGKLIMSGGEIIVEAGGKQAIYNETGIVEISGTAKLKSESSTRATVQNISSGILTITGGEIIGEKYSAINNKATMTIGIKDDEEDNTSPTIIGTPYGIDSSADFNYYDGIIKGKTRGINNATRVIETEIGYAVYTSQEEIDGITYNTVYLDKAVAEIGGKYYSSMQGAINTVSADNTKATIKLLKDTIEDITIAKNKNIEFDLQNYKISNDTNNAVITNNGTITISNGVVESDAEFATINNNTDAILIIKGGKILSTGTRSSVYNYGGVVEIKENAYLKSTTTGKVDNIAIERGTITNVRDGILIITGGTIIGENQHAISNDSMLTIGIANDGNVNTTSPIIIGKTSGVKNTGIFNFYDGIIKGVTDSINGIITNMEMNCTRFDSTEIIDETTYKTVYLQSN